MSSSETKLPTEAESQWVTVRSRAQKRAAARAASKVAASTATTPQKTEPCVRKCLSCKNYFNMEEGFMWYCDMDCASVDGLFKGPY
jgi:hypothetical protein